MTTNIFQITEEPLISVFGIGEDSKKYIEEIKKWESPLVSAKMLGRDSTGSETEIKVAILIITENIDATILAKNLKQSGLLTLIVTTCEIRVMRGSYDSITMVSKDKIIDTVKTFTEFLNMPSYICLDFNDLYYVLENSGTFQIFSHKTSIEKCGIINLANYLKEQLKGISSLERLLVIITFSSISTEPLKMEDLKIIQDFFSTLPDCMVVYGIDASENLASDELSISIIATATAPRINKE